MKKTPLRRIGKRTKLWIIAKRKLKKEYEELGITSCEVRELNCQPTFGLSFHHKHSRYYYYTRPGLDSFEETLLVCASCHSLLQGDKIRSEYYFNKLRDGLFKQTQHQQTQNL
jgi:hypothetical protein